jgi:hypothetical protein
MWIANNGSSTVTRLVAATGANDGTYSISGAGSAWSMAFDGANMWVGFPSGRVAKM